MAPRPVYAYTRPSTKASNTYIFLVCKQIHTEALNTVYRTKTLVITVTSATDILHNLDKNWPPLRIGHFSRMRIDLILHEVAPKTLRDCFSGITSLLRAQALSLQFLNIRIGYPESGISGAVRRGEFQLMIGSEDIVDSMRELTQLVDSKGIGGITRDKPLHISWGISAHQKRVGDFSCACKYLDATCLGYLWSCICEGLEGDVGNVGLSLLEENCQDMGCKLIHP
jgi:hypothetical protein